MITRDKNTQLYHKHICGRYSKLYNMNKYKMIKLLSKNKHLKEQIKVIDTDFNNLHAFVFVIIVPCCIYSLFIKK